MLDFLDKYIRDCYLTINKQTIEYAREDDDGELNFEGKVWTEKLNYSRSINEDISLKELKYWICSTICQNIRQYDSYFPKRMSAVEYFGEVREDFINIVYPCLDHNTRFYTTDDTDLYVSVNYFIQINGIPIEEEDLVQIMRV